MPFSPSDFQWWVWLICGVIGLIAAYTATDAADLEPGWWLVAIPAWLVGIGCIGLGVIRFIKWAWEG